MRLALSMGCACSPEDEIIGPIECEDVKGASMVASMPNFDIQEGS